MRFQFIVKVEVERSTGKFATRDEIADQIRESLEMADLGSIMGDNGGEYETIEWEVEDA